MECQHKQRHWYLDLLDSSGACASLLCAIHCIATPLFFALAPVLGGFFSHHSIHIAMFSLVLPIALITLGFSAYRTKRWWLFLTGVFGCGLLALGIELEHAYSPGWLSPATWVNILGGLTLATAHIYNLKLREQHITC